MSNTILKLVNTTKTAKNLLVITDKSTDLENMGLSKESVAILRNAIKQKISPLHLQHDDKNIWIDFQEKEAITPAEKENYRKSGVKALGILNAHKITSCVLHNLTNQKEAAKLYAEGIVLGNYQFLKYKTGKNIQPNALKELQLLEKDISKNDFAQLQIVTEATLIARNLVNEPVCFLTAEQLSKEIQKLGKAAGFKVEVFNKAKIQSLKMGGLLAVNLGSKTPPTFSILEYKPKTVKNKKPLVLVGKGIVYDTGGLSLKPTENSMDKMKSDMAGAAAVTGAMYAIAKAKLPVHVVALIPATDNRPGENAYTPGDVIKMHNGLNVEVLNTDAEGRMILADALSYAQKYNPELVIDVATLTGAAMRAIGSEGIVYMGTADDKTKQAISESGYNVHERLVEFPLWEEYDAYIKSDIADLKNVGGALAGATTAGMFLKHFTNYPWLHLDIAGVAMFDKNDGYRLKNGTGVGVRLLFDFIKNRYQ
jgi:leucyl aminopeptidase